MIMNQYIYLGCSPLIVLQYTILQYFLRRANSLLPNSAGTYNNQYMVLDLKKIELEKEVHDDALWVVEQIPG